MSLVLYLDLFSGAGGDMLLAALLDLGLPLSGLRTALAALALPGCEVSAEKAESHGLAGTRLLIRNGSHNHPARRPAAVRDLIQSSTLSPGVKAKSLAILGRLARAEARVHGVPVEEVHFHEIAGVDTIVDIVGFAAGLEMLGIQEVCSSPVPLGTGTIQTEHGLLPVPAPATAALLAEEGVRTCAHPARDGDRHPHGCRDDRRVRGLPPPLPCPARGRARDRDTRVPLDERRAGISRRLGGRG